MITRLEISIGPVQGFVAQSRRTRDLWGSSYLLAFLSGHAMRGAAAAGGKIVQPIVDGDPLYRWIQGEGRGESPQIGSLPNHFVVECDGDGRAIADCARAAMEKAWDAVCSAVWAEFVACASSQGRDTKAIWDRQVSGFWDFIWVADAAEVRGQLARRKHWRTHWPPDEPGDKCSVMHDLQELSGHVRATGAAERERQEGFWEAVRRGVGPLDLREDERLCAVALVKRLFPKVAEKALGWKLDTAHWPSTVYVAAVPWTRRVVSAAAEKASRYAARVASVADGVIAEQAPRFAGLDHRGAGDFPRLDASFYHHGFLRDARLCPFRDHAAPSERETLRGLLNTISEVEDADGPLGSPPVFYALLLADGDRLGRLVGKLGGREVSAALSTFTEQAPGLVAQHDGVAIYAGGDDVLAMIPVARALSCARDLSDSYRRTFSGVPEATLSASVSFAHVRIPLSAVVREAHRLLDSVAKEGNGRDSIAAAVLKRGGLHCQWVTTWERPVADSDEPQAAIPLFDGFVAQLRRVGTEAGLSTTLLHRVQHSISLLCGWPRWEPGSWAALPSDMDIRPFLRAEIARTLPEGMAEAAGVRAEELAGLASSILTQSRKGSQPSARVGTDALLLARFLADGGREEHEG
jgi:CRISPR-associated protein Cmr2